MIGWQQIDENTNAMIVPTGMVIHTADLQESGNGITMAKAMCFVPCTFNEALSWIREMKKADSGD